VASAEPEPLLTEPEPVLLSLLLVEPVLLPFVVVVLPVVVPPVLVVPLDASSEACERAAAPIAIVAARAATARPDVTTVVVRRAASRWFIGSS
jgi:hypothetical protein